MPEKFKTRADQHVSQIVMQGMIKEDVNTYIIVSGTYNRTCCSTLNAVSFSNADWYFDN
jgi:hypothetical protein